MSSYATQQPQAQPSERPFQADVARLLNLMVHSIYSEKDIFLRELISNASDACEKLRFEAISDPSLIGEDAAFSITIETDKSLGVLSVSDNGIGMSHDELISALGTIANSGTRHFLEKLESKKASTGEDREEEGGKPNNAAELIGQFGIGFYAAFMVAFKVDVQSRRANSEEAWLWSSDGKGSYTTSALAIGEAPTRGTRVVLHLNDASKEYLDAWRLESIVHEHSNAVAIPIYLKESAQDEPRQLSDGIALWTKPKSEIDEQAYKSFYKSLSGNFDDPALTLHWRVEGRHEYTVLAFVPGTKPMDLFDPERKSKCKLYVKRVLISQDSNLLPGWLRFVRLVVDSADLPLNVSREMIQNSEVFSAIKRGVTNRIVQELVKCAETKADIFATLWDNFGSVIKEGLYEDPERRDALFKLARFAASTHKDTKISLETYVQQLRPNQTSIYYLTGDDPKRIGASPQLEGFAARGVAVLLLTDAVDAFWVSTAVGYDGKPFKSITQGAADIQLIPLIDDAAKKNNDAGQTPEVVALLEHMKQTLAEDISDVRTTDRLSESAACLIAGEAGPDRRLERMLSEHGRLSDFAKPVLEINASHPLITGLARRFQTNGDPAFVDDAIGLLLDEARIMDGELPSNTKTFAERLTRLIVKASA